MLALQFLHAFDSESLSWKFRLLYFLFRKISFSVLNVRRNLCLWKLKGMKNFLCLIFSGFGGGSLEEFFCVTFVWFSRKILSQKFKLYLKWIFGAIRNSNPKIQQKYFRKKYFNIFFTFYFICDLFNWLYVHSIVHENILLFPHKLIQIKEINW